MRYQLIFQRFSTFPFYADTDMRILILMLKHGVAA